MKRYDLIIRSFVPDCIKTLLFCSCLLFTLNSFGQQADSVYTVVDQPAEFPGGITEMLIWLRENIHYPGAPEEETVGRTTVSFVVEKDGKLSNVRVSSPSPELTRYLGGLVLSMPKWIPAIHNGQPVRSSFQLPLIICLK
jgi:hypothetical protein